MIIYGLMKFIEKIPERYDRMIGYLTFGGHTKARDEILNRITPGARVLDIGCGTGAFLLEAAKRGAICTGVDSSMSMLRVFKERTATGSGASQIRTYNQSAALLKKTFQNEKFDLVSASLMLGELPDIVLQEVLNQIPGLLSENGVFFICDELWPEDKLRSFLYKIILAVTFVPNFILTRTMIRPVSGLPGRLEKAGLKVLSRRDYAGGIVTLLEVARKT